MFYRHNIIMSLSNTFCWSYLMVPSWTLLTLTKSVELLIVGMQFGKKVQSFSISPLHLKFRGYLPWIYFSLGRSHFISSFRFCNKEKTLLNFSWSFSIRKLKLLTSLNKILQVPSFTFILYFHFFAWKFLESNCIWCLGDPFFFSMSNFIIFILINSFMTEAVII